MAVWEGVGEMVLGVERDWVQVGIDWGEGF